MRPLQTTKTKLRAGKLTVHRDGCEYRRARARPFYGENILDFWAQATDIFMVFIVEIRMWRQDTIVLVRSPVIVKGFVDSKRPKRLGRIKSTFNFFLFEFSEGNKLIESDCKGCDARSQREWNLVRSCPLLKPLNWNLPGKNKHQLFGVAKQSKLDPTPDYSVKNAVNLLEVIAISEKAKLSGRYVKLQCKLGQNNYITIWKHIQLHRMHFKQKKLCLSLT